MEDLVGTSTPANSQSATAEKRKGTLGLFTLVSHSYSSIKRTSMRMGYIVQVHSAQVSAFERNP